MTARKVLSAMLMSVCLGASAMAQNTLPQAQPLDQQIVQKINTAAPLKVENVCVPIKDVSGGQVVWVPNPNGKTWNLVIRYYQGYIKNNHLVMIDLESGQVKQKHYDKGAYGVGLITPNGKAVGHTDGGFQVYDPAKNDVQLLPDVPRIGGETKPIVIGPDGMIHGTGSSGGQALAYMINPQTGQFTDFGKIGPSHEPNGCWGYSITVDERYTYVVSGKIPWYLLALDRQTKQTKVLLTLEDASGIINLGNVNGGLRAGLRYSTGKPEEQFWLANGQAVPVKDAKEAPPAVVKAAPQAPAPPRPTMFGSPNPTSDGKVKLWFNAPGTKAPEADSSDEALKAQGWKLVQFEVPTYPANVYQICATADGKIVGSSGNYLGLFTYDPATNQHKHHGKLGVSVPVMTMLDGVIYMSGYPRGVTYAYDPAKPWTVKANPLHLGSLGNEGSGIHTTYAITSAADGKVYLTGGWYRNGNGGGLGWWDPKTKKAGGTAEGMASYRTTHITTTGNGRYVVMSTLAVADQEKKTTAPAQAKIFVYDTAESKMLSSFETLPGLIHTGAIAGSEGTSVLAISANPQQADKPWHERDALLYCFDALTGKIAWQKILPWPVGFVANENFDNTVNFDFKRGPDGMIWTYIGGQIRNPDPEREWGRTLEDARLVRINPTTGDIQVVGAVGTTGRMVFLGKDLYLTGGSKYHLAGAEYLRRIRNVVP